MDTLDRLAEGKATVRGAAVRAAIGSTVTPGAVVAGVALRYPLIVGGIVAAAWLLHEINVYVQARNTVAQTEQIEQEIKRLQQQTITAAAEAAVAAAQKTAEAAIATATANVAPRRTEAETQALEAKAHWSEQQAKADAEKAMAERDVATANARAAMMTACKTQAEAIVASGVNKYDVPSFLDKECRAALKL